jgi:hypothetical protein
MNMKKPRVLLRRQAARRNRGEASICTELNVELQDDTKDLLA